MRSVPAGRRVVLAALLVTVLVPGPTPAAAQCAPSIPASDLAAFFDGMLASQLRDRGIAGAALAVVQGGEVVLLRGYGYADVERRRRVDPERTLFRIGSVTKRFTFTALMQLEEAATSPHRARPR